MCTFRFICIESRYFTQNSLSKITSIDTEYKAQRTNSVKFDFITPLPNVYDTISERMTRIENLNVKLLTVHLTHNGWSECYAEKSGANMLKD